MISILISLVIILSSILISFSTLLTLYARPAWGVTLAVGLVMALAARVKYKRSLSVQHVFAILSGLCLTAAATTQVTAANGIPSDYFLPLHALPGNQIIYLFLGGLCALGFAWFSLADPREGIGWAALGAGGFFSSVAFFRASSVVEVGQTFSVLAGFALIVVLNSIASEPNQRITRPEIRYWKWIGAFLLVMVSATLLSPVPGQSVDYFVYILVIVSLAALLSWKIRTMTAWKAAAWLVVGFAAGLPVVLSLVKAADIAFHLGWLAALGYRLHLKEMGGANLISRSLLDVAPLGLALMWNGWLEKQERRSWKQKGLLGIGILLQVLIPVILVYARSWEGFFAWLIGMGLFLALSKWNTVQSLWRRYSYKRYFKVSAWSVLLVLFLCAAVVGVKLAVVANPSSFNGRLAHWANGFHALIRYPLLGGGPGNEYLFASNDLNLTPFEQVSQVTNDPLYSISFRYGIPQLHAHNLFLDIGAFTGFAGLISFVGGIVALFWFGLRSLRRMDRMNQLLAAACLACLAAEIAWGMLDVLRETPPFFSFPIWAVVALLLVMIRDHAPREEGMEKGPSSFRKWVQPVSLAAGILIVLLPSLSGNFYSSGFLAYQQHRWQDAENLLTWAVRLNSLSAQDRNMLARVNLESGEYAQAYLNFLQASQLKRGYSPYLMDAAWMAWINQDLSAAQRLMQEAAANDPMEVWSPGAHAALGILAAYQQNNPDETLRLITMSLEMHPDLAKDTYWVEYDNGDNGTDRVLDPVFTNGIYTEDLQSRLLARLGKSDLTSRNFHPVSAQGQMIAFRDVLADIHSDYLAAKERSSDDANLLLATEAETARLTGYSGQAEAAYKEFQASYPNSIYGFRDLGLLYENEGRLSEAVVMLEKAASASSNDLNSVLKLANLQIEQGNARDALASVDRATSISWNDTFHFNLFNVDLYQLKVQASQMLGDTAGQKEAQKWIVYIRGLPENYLALAEISSGDSLTQTCWTAVDLLVRHWVRPYDPRLWQSGQCLAKSSLSDLDLGNHLNQRVSPFISHLLAGHIFTARGKIDAAISQYALAAEAKNEGGAAFYFLGQAYLSAGQTEKAVESFQKADVLDPYESMPLLAVGKIYESQGNIAAARSAYQAAVTKTPGWADAQIAYGNLLLKLGEKDQAKALFKNIQAGSVYAGELVYGLNDHLADADLSSTVLQGFIKQDVFTIQNSQKNTIYMHPDSWAAYTLILPQPQAGEQFWLLFSAGLSPYSWDQEGDGVGFRVTLTQGTEEHTVFDQYIDPKKNLADRRWVDSKIDLTPFAGQTVIITLSTNSGPAGDNRFDWAGWGNVSILKTQK